MKTSTSRLKLTLLAAVFAIALAPSSGRAGSYGDDKWCAVTNDGGDAINWDCEYDTVEDCRPAVLSGNRGSCMINPYWRPPEPDPPTPQQR